MIAVYKIKNGKGEFSTGGCSPSWTNRGKSWAGSGPLRSHLAQFIDGLLHIDYIPHDWIVVEFTGTGIKEYNASKFYFKIETK